MIYMYNAILIQSSPYKARWSKLQCKPPFLPNPFSRLLICSTYPKRALYLCLKCVVNTITSYLMSALCRSLPESKYGKNISQTVFLTGEEILPGYIRLPKMISLGNSYLRYYTGSVITKKELKKFNTETDDHCNFYPRPDSIVHTFLESWCLYFTIF